MSGFIVCSVPSIIKLDYRYVSSRIDVRTRLHILFPWFLENILILIFQSTIFLTERKEMKKKIRVDDVSGKDKMGNLAVMV